MTHRAMKCCRTRDCSAMPCTGTPRFSTAAMRSNAAWRAIDPILGNRTPVHEYETGSWGPREAEAIAADIGGWRNPAASHND